MHRIALPAALAALLTALPAASEPENYSIDPRHTFPSYEVSHLGYSMQRGRFNKSSGRIMLDEVARKCTAEVVIDAASVSSGVDKLDEHLRSEDFFNAAKNPGITFRTSDCAFEGSRVKSARGELTLNGVTRPVVLTANLFHCAPHPITKKKQCGGDFEATVRRSDFGMKYGLPALGDEVKLRINVEALKD